MSPLVVSSPHAHQRRSTATVMRSLLLACIPGLAALTWFFGWGAPLNVVLAVVAAVATEAVILRLRERPVAATVRDSSAIVTGVLLGLALPPLLPWWMTMLGASFAIVFGKQLYGGIGQNPFNPAMLGYVVLLISFPAEMSTWAPAGAGAAPLETLRITFSGTPVPDALTGATPLDSFKFRDGLTNEEWRTASGLAGSVAGRGWEWVNLAFLVGGLWMLRLGLFTWHAPLAMLATLTFLALCFWDGGSAASHGSPLLHLFSGATMFGAFFILTDPVSSATSLRGRLLFGAGAGLLVYVIRAFGNYPDAVAFAVLLMNLAAPFIDQYTKPRTYGHARRTP